MAILLFGLIIGFGISHSLSKQDKKNYPIKIVVFYEDKYSKFNDNFECDSVKNDTIYKDGIFIINKNIINTSFK